MAVASARWLALGLCGWALMAAAGCEKTAPDDMNWAERALARNERLQVLAVDRQARAFTVRLKDTGELRIVQADEVVGYVPATMTQAAAAPSTSPAALVEPAATAKVDAAPADESSGVAPPPAPVPAAPLATGPGVIASGPGYSIRAARADGAAGARGSGFAPNDSIGRGLPLERRDEPMICQGARFLRIDGRNLEFEGDAISAEDGCEIHITNSRIAAKGVGVSARAASVHIENSSIEGKTGSILASDGAQVYAESSRFRGVSRGLTSESLHDLGGNVWN
ncbi:MAG TPA: hypothetical protein VII70_10580 [Steroidobacteraceae bacterium]